MSLEHIQRHWWLILLSLGGSVRAQSSSSPIQSVVPTCAQPCLQQSINQSFTTICPNQDFTCLCTHYGSDGYTLGEKALSCIYSNICGQDAAPNPTPVYNICDSVANAVLPTHTNIQAALFGGPGSSTGIPSVSSATSTSSSSQATRPASSLAVSPQLAPKKLDSIQITAVALASVALFVVALTAAALLLLRSRRKLNDLEHDKESDSGGSPKSPHGSKSAHGRRRPQGPEKKSRLSLSRNPGGSASRTWPKYYRISPPPQLGTTTSSSTLGTDKPKAPNGRISKPDISLVPDVDPKRRAVRISGFTTPPQNVPGISPPERSPLRSSTAPSLSMHIPPSVYPTPPTQVFLPVEHLSVPSSVPSSSASRKPRNLVSEISRAAGTGPMVNAFGEHASQRDPRSSRSKPRTSNSSQTRKVVETSPLADKDRRHRDERRSKKKHSKSKSSDHPRRRESSPSRSRSRSTDNFGRKYENKSLNNLAESPISNLQYPKVPQARTPILASQFSQANRVRPIQNSTPPRTMAEAGYTPTSYSSISTYGQSDTTPNSTTSFHYPFTLNGQRRLEVNSAPVMGPMVYYSDQTNTPIYHSSWEIQKQASLQSLGAVSWPGAGGSYGFF
jgi:hypothetical protein